MNTLPPDIIDIFFIPKYLDKKYHKYSLQFKWIFIIQVKNIKMW